MPGPLALALGGALLGACASDPGPAARQPVQVEPGALAARPLPPSAIYPALINGDPVAWGALRGRLAEAAGRLVLEEVALERLLEQELADRGMELTPADIHAEQEILLSTVDGAGERSRDERLQLLEALRTRRGLGEERLNALLRRSAMLRKLVVDKVIVEELMVVQRHRTLYGERYLVRAIVLPTELDATQALRDLRQAEGAPDEEPPAPGVDAKAEGPTEAAPADDPALRARFMQMAMDQSIDATAARGGLLEPISPADPTYPAALRDMLPKLAPGRPSPPVAIDRGSDQMGFAILLLEEAQPAQDVPLDDVRDEIAAELRLRQERILMQDLATRLLDSADIRPLDTHLAWSWEARER